MEKLVEMVHTIAGSLEKGARFLYDEEKDHPQVLGWIRAGYARYVEAEENGEPLVASPGVGPATNQVVQPVGIESEEATGEIGGEDVPAEDATANAKRTKKA